MKFTIIKNEFLKTLLQVGKIIPQKSTTPINTNIKISLTNDRLILTGTNGKVSITSFIPFFKDDKEIIRDIKPGSILVNNNFITEIAKKIEGDELTFEVLEDNIARIKNEKSKFDLNVIDADEFPPLNFEVSGGSNVVIDAQDFIDGINHVAFAASAKSTKIILTGINIEATGEKLSISATDGYRLAKKDIPLATSERFSITVDAKSMTDVLKSITDEKEIHLKVDDKNIVVELNNTLIMCGLIVGEYPNIKDRIPKSFYYVLEANSQDVLAAIDRVNILNSNNLDGNIIKLTMSESNVVFSCKSIQDGASEEILTLFKYTGDRLEINLNSNYVVDAIRALKSEDVVLSFLGEMKFFTVTSKADPSVVNLIVPVKA